MSNAKETYQIRISKIEKLIENLKINLKKHSEDFNNNPENWGCKVT